ncbi:MAG: dTDP-4-dehydrorhamnose reductase [Saprospiraceae bacterium]|nr:dTDP-4-dehydrorhamnose reductase [Saprospiraceae bacterium]
MKKILITGAGGQLGRELSSLGPSFPEFELIALDKSQLDLTKADHIQDSIQGYRPDFCLNCAAYTAVDRAESEAKRAFEINAEGAGILAEACRSLEIPLVHYSTDYVYHNGLDRPLTEADPVQPRSVYARTKLGGENAVLEGQPRSIVLRTSWVYSPFGHNFVKSMLRLGKERKELKVVSDQIGTPTYAHDLARASLHMLDALQKGQLDGPPWGTYNYSNEGVCSWYDFALEIFDMCDLPCRVSPIPSEAYPTAALRPHYSVLDKSKFKKTFQTAIPWWKDSLRDCLSRMKLV